MPNLVAALEEEIRRVAPVLVAHSTPPMRAAREPEQDKPRVYSRRMPRFASTTREKTNGHFSGLPRKNAMSPPRLIWAKVGSLLGSCLCLVVLVGSVSCKSENASEKQLVEPLLPKAAHVAQEQRRAKQEEEWRSQQEKAKVIDQAKQVLLQSLSSVGGTPEENVQKGIELLSLYPDEAANDVDVKLLLEHAQIAVSDDKSIQFLNMISDHNRRKVANSADDMIIVNQSELEALSEGFSTRFKNTVRGTRIFVCGQSWGGGGRFCNSIETAFYATLARNAKRDIEQRREKRKAIREENPQLTALIFGIEENPEAFAGRCLYFDNFMMYGKTDKKNSDDYRLGVTDSRGKFYRSVGVWENETIFTTSGKVAAQIHALTRADTKYKVKLYCDMYVSTQGGPWAFVYKIDFYNEGGGVALTIKD